MKADKYGDALNFLAHEGMTVEVSFLHCKGRAIPSSVYALMLLNLYVREIVVHTEPSGDIKDERLQVS